MWEKVTDSLVSLPVFNIFRLSTLQSCCKSAIVSSVVVAFVVSCEQWLHLCSTINLARFSAINLNCTSFCSCDKNEQVEVESCSLPPAMPLIYDRPTWFIIHSSLFPSLTYSLSFSLCVFSCWCRDWQLLAVCCKWSCYSRLLARLSTNDWGQFLMSAELVCSLPQLASVCPPFCVSVSLLCSVFLFAVPPVIAGNFA